jgi:chorismate mutase
MYRTATTVSSDRGNEIYSIRIVDKLLLNNGLDTETVITAIKE